MNEPDETTPRVPGAAPGEPGPAPTTDPRQTIPGSMPTPRPEEPTVGTGSTIAIGCVVGMVLVLGLGILIMLWLQ